MDRAGLYELLDAYLRALGSRDAKAVRWAGAPQKAGVPLDAPSLVILSNY
jgi:hypothetical protein